MKRVRKVLSILCVILLIGLHHAHASEQEHSTLSLVRKAAAEGRISYKRTTPEQFKQIAGKPTKERVSEDGEVVELEYPGVLVKFFGKPDLDTPVAILWIAYDGGNIDIGENRYKKTVKAPLIKPFDKERAKNPGLGVRRLHEKGITGRGVRIAILDQVLLVDHQEYAERVRFYEKIDLPDRVGPQMHGAAVASIAVGKTVGVAPEAGLYYIAKKGGPRYVAQGIDRILEVNEQLPKDNKIRVISISVGWTPSVDSYEDNMAACERAKAAGIFVVSCSLEEVYGFSFHGLGRHPSADPDLFESYEPGLWWAKNFYNRGTGFDTDHLLIPMDSRTTASPNGKDEYIFHRKGGWSWSVPYLAGVYALAVQVEPDITPDRFWNLALKTGRTIQLEHEGEKRPFGLIIDPVRLIRSIEAGKLSDVSRNQSGNAFSEGVRKEDSRTHTIVPGVGVDDYTLGMSKDDVLKTLGDRETIQLGKDEVIRRGQRKYNLNDLPGEYILSFGDVSFWFEDDSVQLIHVHSPLYKLGNGLGLGDSEQKIKQAFGEDFDLEEARGREVCWYQAKGVGFEIHKRNRTVAGILVYHDVQDSAEAALIRKAAEEGRIAYKLTTPDEFKAIAGPPIREWTASGDDEIYLEYPGIRARFFGKPDMQTPHTLISIWCEGMGIDIGRDRPIVLRHEGDLDKLGSFSNVDLSRLDLSQKGEIVKATTFDSLTVWPTSDRLPPNFDPVRLLEWGKNPGLGVRSLHREGITGKGVGIAIIDQPLLKDHVEYVDRIRSYHAIDVEGVGIMGHGSPVCSIAVGKTCGVAPEASLHYYAHPPWKWRENRPWARTVEQIVELNQDLSSSEKVRVISISNGLFSKRDYLDQWKSAVKKAHKNGILVVTCDPRFLRYVTLERIVGTDPDNPNNYSFESGVYALYVPAGNWSIASSRGKDVYTFDTRGANSWTVPYLAGLAALAFQVHPEISPDRIVTLFQKTATQTKRGRVINPTGFVEAVKQIKAQGS